MKELSILLSKGAIDLALTLLIIAVFIWAIALAVVFLIKVTRTKEILGAKFDPEKPHTNKRAT